MPDLRHLRPSPWTAGTVAAAVGAAWLYHQLTQTRRERSTAEKRLASLTARSTDPIVVVDDSGTIRWWSTGADRLLGGAMAAGSLLGRVLPVDRPRLAQAIVDGAGEDIPVRICGPGDVWTEVQASLEDRRADSLIGGVVVTLRPSLSPTDAVHWRHRALHDNLTNLANRGGLFESLDLLADPAEASEGRPCAVLYGDLDRFKHINDTYGHAAGDRVLREVAERLRRQVRPGDTVARIGGDEFVLVIDAVSHEQAAMEIAERIRNSLSEPIDLGSVRLPATASFGVAVGRDHQASALLDRADGALYEAKRLGRNRCVLWTADLARTEETPPGR